MSLVEPDREKTERFRPQVFFEDLPANAPPEIRKFVNEWGDATIINVAVCRTPINKNIQKVGNLLSFGKMERVRRELGYENLFHLYLVLTLERPDGSSGQFFLEKDQKVKYRVFDEGRILGDSQCINGSPSGKFTLQEMFARAERIYGAKELWVYDLRRQNCQQYVLMLLNAIGVRARNITNFVLQEPERLLPPLLGWGAKQITDIANRIESFLKGI